MTDLFAAADENVRRELAAWQEKMLRPPSFTDRVSRKMQQKMNSFIPEKIHVAITATMKQMIRGVLFGAEFVSRKQVTAVSLAEKEAKVLERINFYRTAAAAEGGITGAGGLLLGLADFPIFLSLKLKLLFEISALYGFASDDYRERIYLLYIFQLAFSSAEKRREIYLQMANWETHKQNLPADIHQFDWRSFQQEYRDYIDLAKMAQLIPVIGAPVGVVANYKLTTKLGVTAINAYRMRWFNAAADTGVSEI
ncbi:EcsC family protein [Adhaeribacter terreus]|uniref:EcsC family protein n=1 Tax=Adhaeribacter terreus TaxID=529703 RepID=A0ABW0E9T8_9BACT